MKIEEHMISDREIAGTTGAGEDVLGIKTHGGLYAYFLRKKSGGYKTLAMAPHKAIASWIAEQAADSKIHWNALEKSEPPTEEQVYDSLVKALYIQTDDKAAPSDYFIAFNHKSGDMRLAKSRDISELAKNEGTNWVVRNLSLSSPCSLACFWENT